MARKRKSIHGEWSSRWAFILAATGSAVGLGNIWRFPYLTGENGGGAFVLIYLFCVAVIGIPVMIAEIMLGRRGRMSPINTMRALAHDEGLSRYWQVIGWLGMLAGFLILSFYSVVAGWTLAYVFRSGAGIFSGMTAENVSTVFSDLVSDPERLLAWHTIFMAMTTMVVARGVRSGLEKAVRWLMPALFLLLLVLVGYAMGTGSFQEAVRYLFKPDFSSLSAGGVMSAMGQAFFSLSVGMGAIMIYGSYLSHTESIPRMTIIVALADTLVAILAGLAIFPIVFAYGLQPQEGSGLIFKTLPIAFGHMPGGAFFGCLFFLLLMMAAWTSAISLLEPVVAWLVENRGMTRVHASILACGIVWILGLGALFSLNIWSDATLFGKTFFGLLEYLTANIMLPVGGFLIALFAGWRLSRAASVNELGLGQGFAYQTWRILVRYITPVGLILVFLHVLGVLDPT
ncbi:MAG: sodium-dependent transporter [Gammaproteobacteria bacterium]